MVTEAQEKSCASFLFVQRHGQTRPVERNRRRAQTGGKTITVKTFAQDLPDEIAMLVRELLEKSYRPQPVTSTCAM